MTAGLRGLAERSRCRYPFLKRYLNHLKEHNAMRNTSSFGFSGMAMQPARHERNACCLLQTEKIGYSVHTRQYAWHACRSGYIVRAENLLELLTCLVHSASWVLTKRRGHQSPLVELSVARIIRHRHPHGYPCGYPSKWRRGDYIRMDVRTLWSFTWISIRISVRMSMSNYPYYG